MGASVDADAARSAGDVLRGVILGGRTIAGRRNFFAAAPGARRRRSPSPPARVIQAGPRLRYHHAVASDDELLKAWRAGDEDAGVELFERYYDAVSRFFRSKAWDAAADLIQRTFLACLETRDRMRDGTTFRCYLFGVARNILFEHYRGKRRDGNRLDVAERSLEDLGATPTTALVRAQESQLLLQALRHIPLEHQMILELYYWEDMTAVDIAAVLSVPEGTARTRIRRAKQLLEAELARLANTPQLLQSTVSDLEAWAAQLRDGIKAR